MEGGGLSTMVAHDRLVAKLSELLVTHTDESSVSLLSCICASVRKSSSTLRLPFELPVTLLALQFLSGVLALILLLWESLESRENIAHLALLTGFQFGGFALNLAIRGYIYRSRCEELLLKAHRLLDLLQTSRDSKSVFSHLDRFQPLAESVELCWVYRDSRIVALPKLLIVEGDRIFLRPGRPVPCHCQTLEQKSRELRPPSVFRPAGAELRHSMTSFVAARALETPCVVMWNHCLSGTYTRPVSVFGRQCNTVYYLVYRFLLPVALCSAVALTGIWSYALGLRPPSSIVQHTLLHALLICQPLVLLAFPSLALLVHYVCELCMNTGSGGSGQLEWTANMVERLGSVTTLAVVDKKGLLSSADARPEKLLFFSQPEAASAPETTRDPPLEDTTHDTSSLQRSLSTRSAQRIQSGGRRPYQKTSIAIPPLEIDSITEESEALLTSPSKGGLSRGLSVHVPMTSVAQPHVPVATVLDLFDTGLRPSDCLLYGSSLRVLGDNIRRNSCQHIHRYVRFLDHLSAAADAYPGTLAVNNRRCLCDLADTMMQSFATQKPPIDSSLCVFRPPASSQFTSSTTALFDQPVQQHSFYRTPLPHAFATVYRQQQSKHWFCASQGTADLLAAADACPWIYTGSGLRPMTKQARKRILDFYHRSSMTAFCVALTLSPLCLQPHVDLKDTDAALLTTAQRPIVPSLSMTSPLLSQLPAVLALSEDTLNSSSVDTSEMQCLRAENFVEQAILHRQVFLGLIALQYQVRPHVVNVIEQLDAACIRFVYFSKDNELRSRVFAERMGLEAGWNCHISLAADESTGSLNTTAKHEPRHRSRKRALSLPHNTRLRAASSTPRTPLTDDTTPLMPRRRRQRTVSSSSSSTASDGSSSANTGPIGPQHYLPGNEANLPRGVSAIRPHLQAIDNVPLLVSLFTDCTPASTHEMVKIMQEHGEVVCVLGSLLNTANAPTFASADISIGVEVSPPVSCVKRPSADASQDVAHLASQLASLPCSAFLPHLAPISNLVQDLAISRVLITRTRTSLLYLLKCYISLALLQLLSLVTQPPALLLPISVQLWLGCLLVPMLFATLLGRFLVDADQLPSDRIAVSTMKNEQTFANRQHVRNPLGSFAVKFLPSCILTVALYKVALVHICYREQITNDNNENRTLTDRLRNCSLQRREDVDHRVLSLVQIVCGCLFCLYLTCISGCFLQTRRRMCPLSRKTLACWLLSCLVVLSLQLVLSTLYCKAHGCASLRVIPVYTYAVGISFSLVVLVLNELYKLYEIKMYNRAERRHRLQFNTKLGMNSPF